MIKNVKTGVKQRFCNGIENISEVVIQNNELKSLKFSFVLGIHQKSY
jgi:hypothetical protein